jgi:predicted histidine transporter YuiF (NhaC family)
MNYTNTHHYHNHFMIKFLFNFYNQFSNLLNHACFINEKPNNYPIHFWCLSKLLNQFKVSAGMVTTQGQFEITNWYITLPESYGLSFWSLRLISKVHSVHLFSRSCPLFPPLFLLFEFAVSIFPHLWKFEDFEVNQSMISNSDSFSNYFQVHLIAI